MALEKTSSQRRSNKNLEDEIICALEYLVEQRGFAGVTLAELIKVSRVEASVFLRRYKKIETLLNILATKYDFWQNDSINVMQIKELGPKKFYSRVLKNLYLELSKSKVMQKMILWKLNDDKHTTHITRKEENLKLLSYYDSMFYNSEIDIKGISAILISGIYFIVLSKHQSKICSIDFSTKEADEIVHKSIDTITDLLFSQIESKSNLEQIAQRMRADGVTEAKIKEYLG